MNISDPNTRAKLAADYVSQVMQGGARRRFESWMEADHDLRQQVEDLENRLAPMGLSLEPIAPPAYAWHAIRRQVGFKNKPRPWSWSGVSFWRLTSGALAALLIGVAVVYPYQVQEASRKQLVAVLESPQAKAMLVVSTDASGSLRIRPLQDLADVAKDGALELWALPAGATPKSLGLVAVDQVTAIQAAQKLIGVSQLAVSLEPKGGSPTGLPTGPVLVTGSLLDI